MDEIEVIDGDAGEGDDIGLDELNAIRDAYIRGEVSGEVMRRAEERQEAQRDNPDLARRQRQALSDAQKAPADKQAQAEARGDDDSFGLGVFEASQQVEAELESAYAGTLSREEMATVKANVGAGGGNVAAYAIALAAIAAGRRSDEQIATEVKAQLMSQGLIDRGDDAGPSRAAAGGSRVGRQATKAQIETAYINGEIDVDQYTEALKAFSDRWQED